MSGVKVDQSCKQISAKCSPCWEKPRPISFGVSSDSGNGEKEQHKEVSMGIILPVLDSEETKRFQGCMYKTSSKPAHTGIAVFLDENCFTIDYTTLSGKSEVLDQLSGEGSVDSAMQYFKYGKTPTYMKKGDVIQDIDLTTDLGRPQGMAVLTTLGKKDTTKYHVAESNCRHHVKRCVKRAAKVSKAMNIPFLISPGRVITKVEKFMFGTGEGTVAQQEGHVEARGNTRNHEDPQNEPV